MYKSLAGSTKASTEKKKWARKLGAPTKFLALLIASIAALSIAGFAAHGAKTGAPKGAVSRLAGRGLSIRADVATCEAETGKSFPNLQFVSYGYNLYKGNPHQDVFDEGWTLQPVFELGEENGEVTPDGRYCLPEKVSAVTLESCAISSSHSTVFGESSMAQTLAVDVSVNGAYEGVGKQFSMNAAFQSSFASQYSQSSRRIATTSTGICARYGISMLQNAKVSASFRESLGLLPESYTEANSAEWMKFVDTYGTHVPVSLVMGSKYLFQAESTEQQFSQAEQEGFRLDANAEFAAASASGGASAMTEKQKEKASKFESFTSSTSHSTLGSPVPDNGDVVAWAQASTENPYPIRYKLQSIASALDPIAWDAALYSDHKVASKQSALESALRDYCHRHGAEGCHAHLEDAPRLRIYTEASEGRKRHQVLCRDGDLVVGCGLRNTYRSGETLHEAIHASPFFDASGASGCACHTPAGGDCVARCVEPLALLEQGYGHAVKQFEEGGSCNTAHGGQQCSAAESAEDRFAAECRKGQAVLGCGFHAQNADEYYGVLPFQARGERPAGCECFHAKARARKCYAICADAEALSSYALHYGGRYETTADFHAPLALVCPQGAAFGVGFKPLWTDQMHEHYPAFANDGSWGGAEFFNGVHHSTRVVVCADVRRAARRCQRLPPGGAEARQGRVAFHVDPSADFTLELDFTLRGAPAPGVAIAEVFSIGDEAGAWVPALFQHAAPQGYVQLSLSTAGHSGGETESHVRLDTLAGVDLRVGKKTALRVEVRGAHAAVYLDGVLKHTLEVQAKSRVHRDNLPLYVSSPFRQAANVDISRLEFCEENAA